MKAKELDEKFDSGEDITGYLDLDRARRPAQEPKRVNVDFPIWMVQSQGSQSSGRNPAVDHQILDRGKAEGHIVVKWSGGPRPTGGSLLVFASACPVADSGFIFVFFVPLCLRVR